LLVLLAQGIFYNLFFLLYLCSPKTAHRVVGYFEEEAVFSYTEYLAGVDNGTYANVPAPQIAIDYWKLPPEARLRDVIIVIRICVKQNPTIPQRRVIGATRWERISPLNKISEFSHRLGRK
jgi:hypothetical protein